MLEQLFSYSLNRNMVMVHSSPTVDSRYGPPGKEIWTTVMEQWRNIRFVNFRGITDAPAHQFLETSVSSSSCINLMLPSSPLCTFLEDKQDDRGSLWEAFAAQFTTAAAAIWHVKLFSVSRHG